MNIEESDERELKRYLTPQEFRRLKFLMEKDPKRFQKIYSDIISTFEESASP